MNTKTRWCLFVHIQMAGLPCIQMAFKYLTGYIFEVQLCTWKSACPPKWHVFLDDGMIVEVSSQQFTWYTVLTQDCSCVFERQFTQICVSSCDGSFGLLFNFLLVCRLVRNAYVRETLAGFSGRISRT